MREGARHEKVGILLAAYIIGFTTAFIAFELNDLKPIAKFGVEPYHSTLRSDSVNNRKSDNAIIFQDASGLYIGSEDTKILISLNAAEVPDITEPTAGVHHTLHGVVQSPDGAYVYFCEQQILAVSECVPFIYEVATSKLYPVAFDGDAEMIDPERVEFRWSAEGVLTAEGMSSVSADSPWRMETSSGV